MDGYPILELVPPSLPTWEGNSLRDAVTGDIYASSHGALEQARHVFLGGNGLPGRWEMPEAVPFVIGELGFGTGLNFLAVWDQWRRRAHRCAPLQNHQDHHDVSGVGAHGGAPLPQYAPASQRLIYISIEHNPLPPDVILAAAKKHPEILPLAGRLISRLPPRLPGFHQIVWESEGVELILIQGDAQVALRRLEARVDAWFLDGFAPSKNPAMWGTELLQRVGELTNEGGTLATWCVAGAVKRDLEAAGFSLEKREGFAGKREMLTGKKGAPLCAPTHEGGNPKHVVVVGAGLAGCSVARALVRRGARVTVLESKSEPAMEASGNPAGLLLPNATKIPTPLSALTEAGFLRTLDLIDDLAENGHPVPHRLDGALKLAPTADLDTRLRGRLNEGPPASFTAWVNPQEAEAILGTPTSWGGLHYPRGGWIAPRELCLALLNHPGITLLCKAALETVFRRDESGWILDGGFHGPLSCDDLVLATGAKDFAPLTQPGLTPVRGQILCIPARLMQAPLRTLSFGGYLIPGVGGVHVAGTTYDKNDSDTLFRESQIAPILDELIEALPSLSAPDPDKIRGRAGIRAFSRDHIPVAGRGAQGAWMLNGLSSRGLTLAPLLGEWLASRILGEPSPLELPLVPMMDPTRRTLKPLGLRS